MNMNLNLQPEIDQTRRTDMMRRAENIRRVHVVNLPRPQFYAPLLARLGTLLTQAGHGLQVRYNNTVLELPTWPDPATQPDCGQAGTPC